MKRILVATLVLAVFMAGYLAGNRQVPLSLAVDAQGDCQSFRETGKTACGEFLAYWKANGGLAQQGFPISDPFDEKSETDGKTYRVQYFERAVFEMHPELPEGKRVLLTLLGAQKLQARYNGTQPSGVMGAAVSASPSVTMTVPTAAPIDSVGQVFMCKCNPDMGASFTLTLTEVRRTKTVGKTTTMATYALVFFRATNTGKNPAYIANNGLTVTDSQGRKFSLSAVSQYDLQRELNVKGSSDTIQPSLSADVLYVFEVPNDATGLRLSAGVWEK